MTQYRVTELGKENLKNARDFYTKLGVRNVHYVSMTIPQVRSELYISTPSDFGIISFIDMGAKSTQDIQDYYKAERGWFDFELRDIPKVLNFLVQCGLIEEEQNDT